MNFNWTVMSVDDGQATMVVRYETDGFPAVDLNIPQPRGGAVPEDWIPRFAPVDSWVTPSTVQVGATGSAVADAPEEAPSSSPVSEEYLRALIHQVLDEIQAGT